jgi:hypothetical protein
MATYARYVLQAENGEFEASPGIGLRRGGATSGRSSPVKSRSRSPKKRPFSTPPGLSSYQESPVRKDSVDDQEQEQAMQMDQQQQEPATEEDSDSDADGNEAEAPDTPTPMTRAQKRQAYTPLRVATTTAAASELSFLPPAPPAMSPTPAPAVARKPNGVTHVVSNRISASGASNMTAMSTASKNSIFSTPGRDEMERKKALVEVDEGPFARVQSMMDLDEERKRISSGQMEVKEEKKKERGRFGCGCMVM